MKRVKPSGEDLQENVVAHRIKVAYLEALQKHEIVLERKTFTVAMALDNVDLCVEERADLYGLSIAKAIARMFLQKTEEVEYRWPKDWWQHLKLRFFPQWAKKLWPIVYTTKGHTVYLQYPELAIPGQEHLVLLRKETV